MTGWSAWGRCIAFKLRGLSPQMVNAGGPGGCKASVQAATLLPPCCAGSVLRSPKITPWCPWTRSSIADRPARTVLGRRRRACGTLQHAFCEGPATPPLTSCARSRAAKAASFLAPITPAGGTRRAGRARPLQPRRVLHGECMLGPSPLRPPCRTCDHGARPHRARPAGRPRRLGGAISAVPSASTQPTYQAISATPDVRWPSRQGQCEAARRRHCALMPPRPTLHYARRTPRPRGAVPAASLPAAGCSAAAAVHPHALPPPCGCTGC